MISHEHKCIFIHIPRTAGTAIESWIVGKDWWLIEQETKHLIASQAKKIYAEYWDDYFKFSFVRNPWDRMVSILSHSGYYKVNYSRKIDGRRLRFKEYKELFGYPVLIERDYRYSTYEELLRPVHQEQCVYLNILDEDIDFIGRYETLQEDTQFIKEKIGIETDFPFNKKSRESNRRKYQDYYDFFTRKEVAKMYHKDIEKFGYTY
ncbi:MAG: sulfotransferase family 2 domain-containing protein [Bacteroidota bacterium]